MSVFCGQNPSNVLVWGFLKTHIILILGWCSGQSSHPEQEKPSEQVGASSRNNTGSNSILGSTFATEIGSNFIIGVRSTTYTE